MKDLPGITVIAITNIPFGFTEQFLLLLFNISRNNLKPMKEGAIDSYRLKRGWAATTYTLNLTYLHL